MYVFLASVETVYSLIYRVPDCGIFDGMFTVVSNGMALKGAVIQEFSTVPLDLCIYRCTQYLDCKSINFLEQPGGTGSCQLLSKEVGEVGVKLVSSPKWVHLQTPPEDQQDKVSPFQKKILDKLRA